MQQQQPPPKNQNNMITEIDKIPLKTNDISMTEDMNDPLVKDVLSEFENELLLSNKPKNNYKINNNQNNNNDDNDDDVNNDRPLNNQNSNLNSNKQLQKQQSQDTPINNRIPKNSNKNEKIKFYDELLINKSFIICIIIAIIINPYIFTTIINNLPENISIIINSYNYFIKLALIFIVIYLLMIYKIL